MASSKEFLAFVLEQLSALEDVSVRPMMGEYVLYCRGKVVGGIYDDRLLLKPTKGALALSPDCETDIPYPGAKPMLVADADDRALLCRMAEAIAMDLPAPKGKRKNASKTDPQEELYLEFRDTEWPDIGVDHDRLIARAIVVDDGGSFYFVRATRDDEFGKATLIETSGGGVEPGEEPSRAILRELREELGVEAEVLRKIGIVSDYYNLIRRHNINRYYLCRAVSFGKKHLTPDEIEEFHLSTLRLSYEEAVREYETRACTPLGRLIAQRELPILRRARELLTGSSR